MAVNYQVAGITHISAVYLHLISLRAQVAKVRAQLYSWAHGQRCRLAAGKLHVIGGFGQAGFCPHTVALGYVV